nr:PREDICTED: uncharacterized protein LOC108952752 isoform X1 [Musa acuminata subsp. malaccensis]
MLGAEGFAEGFLQGAALQLGVHTTGIRGVGGDGSPCSSPDPVCLLVLEPSHLMQQPIKKTHTFFSSKVEQQSSHGHVIQMSNCAGVCSESIYLVLLLCYLSCLYVNHMDLTMICENWQRTDTVTK